MIRRGAAAVVLVAALAVPAAAAPEVRVISDEAGHKLQVDGEDFMVFGMNWSYVPVGENFSYSLWKQPDALIERVLHRDMGLLREMGVNTLRLTPDVPPRWVAWIHEHYGIHSAINHFMGRYGATIDGVWEANVDYGDPDHRRALLDELVRTVERYRDTPGVLMWILGNENNYGLHWTSYEVEDLPGGDDAARAAALYSLYGEAIARIDRLDSRPVAIANGDLQYIDLIARYCDGLDILGTNVYRGPTARDLFEEVKAKLGIPVLFTEFGADAFDARRGKEDAEAQAEYLRTQWRQIYLESHGKGGAGNAIGGMIFQWSDGWWKLGQTDDLDVHDTGASWSNDAYPHDHVEGENNMNEEWFGITAKDPPDEDGFYEIHPRPAYYLLKEAFELDPYAEKSSRRAIREHFDALSVREHAVAYEADRARADAESLGWFRVSDLRIRLETVGSAGNPATERAGDLVIDHTESFYLGFAFQPSAKARAALTINVVGNVAQNRLDPLFFENRVENVEPPGGSTDPSMDPAPTGETDPDLERLAIYRAELDADLAIADLDGYFRAGHGHWGYEGDFFGLYRNAHYGPYIDIYQADAPFGATLDFKRALEGLKVAFGPQVYWGANPTVITKYRRELGPIAATVVHQEDIASAGDTDASSVVPEPVTRRSTLHLAATRGAWTFEVGGIAAAWRRVGDRYVWTRPTEGPGYMDTGHEVLESEVSWRDTLGAKAEVTRTGGRIGWYAQGGVQGLVADGGPDETIDVTGWSLKPSGRGNHLHAATGMAVALGHLQIAPHALYQKPLVGPNPAIDDAYDPDTGTYFPPVRPRNVLDDPFAVLENRETLGGELLFVWDPTPATWFWAWDNAEREDAGLAASLDLSYRHRPTSRDARTAIIASGERIAFGDAPPANDAWEARVRLRSRPARRVQLATELFAGRDEARGEDPRLVTRYGGSARLSWRRLRAWTELRIDDWGIYDYYRDFNLTYPLQWYGDVSYGARYRSLGIGDIRLGVRGQLRTLDEHSPGYTETATRAGLEYEVMSYMGVNL